MSNVVECDLFLWSPMEDGSVLLNIKKDDEFLKNLVPKLDKFYFQFYLKPFLHNFILLLIGC